MRRDIREVVDDRVELLFVSVDFVPERAVVLHVVLIGLRAVSGGHVRIGLSDRQDVVALS